MRTLFIPQHVFEEILASVLETDDGLETGVTLFGTRLDQGAPTAAGCSGHVVLAIAGPGKRATHESAHYSGDEQHASAVYAALGSAMPGIRWIGELHVHPRGMTWLSGGDLRTIRHILSGSDSESAPEEFIAGVMQRRNGALDIYPFHFTRAWPEGNAMGIEIVHPSAPMVHRARLKAIEGSAHDRPGFCTEPRGSRAARPETRGHRWLREWRKRACCYDFESWYR